MFDYDERLAGLVQAGPQSIPDVLRVMQKIGGLCVDGDGLKWFNWLYLQVTQAVEERVAGGGFHDPGWLAELDVQFAALYFQALSDALTGGQCPACWQAMFSVRGQTDIARIQFALAGMNAHINHDLPFAIVAACQVRNVALQHGTPQYADYTAVNDTLNGLIDTAKRTLHVRLLGDALPDVSHLEDLIAAWDLAGFREHAWQHAEVLWQNSALADILKETIDGITAFASKALLVPVP